MRKISSRIIVCLLVCLVPYLLCLNNAHPQNKSKKESDVIKKPTRSSLSKLEKVYSWLYFFPQQSEYKSIGYSSDWQSKEYVVLIQSKKGKFFEVDRWDWEIMLGSKEYFAYIPSVDTDYGAIIIAFDPSPFGDHFLIKLYDLKKRERIASLWSSEYPLFEDIDGDKEMEMVIFKNVFALDLPGLPNWPVIVRFQKGLIIDKLCSRYEGFIKKHVALTRKEKEILQDWCKKFESEFRKLGYSHCPKENNIKALELQEEVLEKKLW